MTDLDLLIRGRRVVGPDGIGPAAVGAALRAGTIDCVVSDHSPSPPALKHLEAGDFRTAWGGISSVQLALPVIWSQARARGLSLAGVGGTHCPRRSAAACRPTADSRLP